MRKHGWFTPYNRKKVVRQPAATLSDLSKSTGIPLSTLATRMQVSGNKIEIVFKHAGGKYYNLKELTDWHESFTQS